MATEHVMKKPEATNIQLIALDLDGTTLNNKHELSEKTTATLRRLSAQGLTIAIVTGRSKLSAVGYIESLNLASPVPIICYNGSMGFIINGKDEHKVFSMPIPEDPARTLLTFAKKHGLVAQVNLNKFTLFHLEHHGAHFCTAAPNFHHKSLVPSITMETLAKSTQSHLPMSIYSS